MNILYTTEAVLGVAGKEVTAGPRTASSLSSRPSQ
jgi:hypothetical protein